MSTTQVLLPASLVAEASTFADAAHVPLEEFVARAVAERIAATNGLAHLRERGGRGDREKFLAALAKSPDVPPVPGDELD